MNNMQMCMLGDIGENTVKQILESRGNTVTFSDDRYDSVKDMILNNKYLIEVKTQVPYIYKKWLTFDVTQEKKMRNVDYLFIVGYNNTSKRQHDWANQIWVVHKDFKIASRYFNQKLNKEMFAISILDERVEEYAKTPSDVIRMLTRYTTSSFR